jgi:hypothetical protein
MRNPRFTSGTVGVLLVIKQSVSNSCNISFHAFDCISESAYRLCTRVFQPSGVHKSFNEQPGFQFPLRILECSKKNSKCRWKRSKIDLCEISFLVVTKCNDLNFLNLTF